MGQLLIRQVDDVTMARLKAAARIRKTSVEALAREAVTAAVKLTLSEKQALVREMQAITDGAKVAGKTQTPSEVLIRADRDR